MHSCSQLISIANRTLVAKSLPITARTPAVEHPRLDTIPQNGDRIPLLYGAPTGDPNKDLEADVRSTSSHRAGSHAQKMAVQGPTSK